ncbi:MAG: 6-carboxytetrahydropterin synthase [Nitrospirota bacterium]|nr:6-carboxytetrahydropterin synthase [Nitrospirota bacterium]
MPYSTLTKRIEFSASHRYSHDAWDEVTNRQVFGPCFQEHGHNYLLEVTLGGQVDEVTGMIINLYDLKHIVTDVLEEFDHKHLNLDTPYFVNTVPTTENIARVLWNKFSHRSDTRNVSKVKLSEGEDLWAEIVAPRADSPFDSSDQPTEASVSRRYYFSVLSQKRTGQPQGWHLTLTATVNGSIDPMTGRVTDIAILDDLVLQHVTKPFDGKELTQDPTFRQQPMTLGNLLRSIWPRLAPLSGGTLERLTLQDQFQTIVEYSG